MRVVGRRREPEMHSLASGESLAIAARFSEDVAKLAPVGLMRRGVYRFKTHAEANEHMMQCIVERMARTTRLRAR